MWIAVGSVILVSGLLAGLFEAHVQRVRAWDRPAWLRSRSGRWALALGRRSLLVAGLAALFLGSAPVAILVAGALGSAGGWMRWARSDRYAARRLRSELADRRRAHPAEDEAELLRRIVLERHPEWGKELVARIVHDHPTTQGLARIMVRMERGWTGWRPTS